MDRATDAALKPEGNIAADVVLDPWMSPQSWETRADMDREIQTLNPWMPPRIW